METQTVSHGKELSTNKNKSLKELLSDASIKGRFDQMLGKKAAGFISSIISVSQGSKQLQEADPKSIIASAAIAASLDLPIIPSLGQSCIVPYSNNGKSVAQFQIMARGFVQLGLRSGQYKTMNHSVVYDGEIASRNHLTGEIELNPEGKKSDKVIGYLFYFKLLNGFEKYQYMTVEECQAHGKKYSKSYDNPKGKWKLDFHAMALKTVVKMGLSKWGPLSTDMQTAMVFDQAAVNEEGTPDYIDSTAEQTEDEEPKTYTLPQIKNEEKKEDAPVQKKEEVKQEVSTDDTGLGPVDDPMETFTVIVGDYRLQKRKDGTVRYFAKDDTGTRYWTENKTIGDMLESSRNGSAKILLECGKDESAEGEKAIYPILNARMA